MSRRVIALVVVFLILVTAAWWFFLISPRNGKIADLEDQLQTAVAEGDALRMAVASLRAVQENDVAFLAAIGQMEAGIPQEPELAVFIEEINALAGSTGVDLESIAPSEPAPGPGDLSLYEISVTLSLQGDYFELLDFLFRLDDMERIVVVQNISITAAVAAEEEGEDDTTSTTLEGDTTTTSTTTTTLPILQDNALSVSLTVKLYTRSPLLPEEDTATSGDGGGEEVQP